MQRCPNSTRLRDCEWTPGSTCEFCSSGTPLQYRTVASGIALCEGCVNINNCYSRRTTWLSGSPNGTFTLTQTVPWPCLWNSAAIARVRVDNYGQPFSPNPNCSGSPQQTFECDVFCQLQVLAANSIFLWITPSTGPSGPAFYDHLFPVWGGDCLASLVFSSQHASCVGGVCGYGGTMTLRPL